MPHISALRGIRYNLAHVGSLSNVVAPPYDVIDAALQMHGGMGVQRGSVPERLYREIRALRIYEGATEVQKLIVGREALRASHAPAGRPT